MAYKVFYTETAERDLEQLDKYVVVRILKKINDYCGLENPLVKAKKLKNFRIATYRFRIGDYRAIFRVDPCTNKLVILVILRVLHRKEIYEKI